MASRHPRKPRTNSSRAKAPKRSRPDRRISRLPKTLRIQGIEIPVVLSECPDKDALGMFVNFPKPVIYVNPDQPVAEQWSTLFHEVLEAIGVIHALDLPEHVVCALELGLRGVFRDNPGFRLFGTKI